MILLSEKNLGNLLALNFVLIITTLPFFTLLNNRLMIVLCFLWAIMIYSLKETLVIRNKVFLYIIGFYLIGLIFWSITSENIEKGFFILEKRASLLVYPVIFATIPQISQKLKYIIKYVFIFTIVIICLYTFREGFSIMESQDRIRAGEKVLIMSRPYLGFYCSLCFFFLLESIMTTLVRPTVIFFLKILLLLFLVYFLYIILAKGALLAIMLGTFVIINLQIYSKGFYLGLMLFNTIILFIIIGILYINPKIVQFLLLVIKFEGISHNEFHTSIADSFNKRFAIWDCCTELIYNSNNWWKGLTFGDTQSYLDICYKEKGYYYLEGFYPHNEYFNNILGGGIYMLISLLLMQFKIGYDAIIKQNYAQLGFFILISIFFLTEAPLATHKGVVFYSFFSGYFMFQTPDSIKG